MARPSASTSDDVPLQPLSSHAKDENSSPESTPGPSGSQPQPSSPLAHLAHLKARLPRFRALHGDHHHHATDEEEEDENSENELLLDPNLPVDHAQRHQAIPLHPLPTTDHAHSHPKTSLDSDSSDRAPLVPPGSQDDDDDDNDNKEEDEEETEDSPYPEVRAAVHPYDDHTLPCNTVRAWAIGLSLIFLGASMNTLFSLRSPNISLGALIAQVIAWYVLFFFRFFPFRGRF